MRNSALALIVLAATVGVGAQQDPLLAGSVPGLMMPANSAADLPVGRIGANDLLGITVYDAPPLTGPIRVSPEGDIRLPMIEQPIHAAGLFPQGLEKVIAAALVKDHLLVDPIVTVTVMEYDSRPVTVVGAVKSPVTFQAMGPVTLLDAISRAQGLTADAGSEILITSHTSGPEGKDTTLIQRVPVRSLLGNADPTLNIELHGGEVVRVPQAGRVFVVGDVKKPGSYFISDGSQSSIMKALALSEGLGDHAGHTAYIYREEAGAARRNEIPVPLKKIMDRKSPDVSLDANDILYIPDSNGRRISEKVLETMVGAGTVFGSAMIYVYH
jgi:polysaccharide export outer membrane protein